MDEIGVVHIKGDLHRQFKRAAQILDITQRDAASTAIELWLYSVEPDLEAASKKEEEERQQREKYERERVQAASEGRNAARPGETEDVKATRAKYAEIFSKFKDGTWREKQDQQERERKERERHGE